MDDFLLPSEEAVSLMNAEYAKLRDKNASIFATSALSSRPSAITSIQRIIFALYIASVLRYNARYGTEIYDSHGSVGRIQPNASAFRVVNHLEHE